MPTVTQSRNGVDVNRLISTINAIRDNPDLARFQFRGQSRWEHGARSTTKFDSFRGEGSEQQISKSHALKSDESRLTSRLRPGPH